MPVGVCIKMGWTKTGRLPGYMFMQEQESVFKAHVTTHDEDLNETVKTWWRTENFGCRYDNDTRRSVEDQKVMTFLEESTRKMDGRYEVPLIWRDDKVDLLKSYDSATQRLYFVEKRLNRDPEQLQILLATGELLNKTWKRDTSKVLLKKKRIPRSCANGTYPRKPGKVRRVCDAAAKFHCSSLNDHLSGPDLLQNLIEIFMRFRKEKVALSADIEAMFNQVSVPEQDQVALRFLRRRSSELPTEVYQYVRHIFGVKCAPTCANYALLRNAEDSESQFPTAAMAVKRNFYMDDFSRSVKSTDEAMELQHKLVEMLKLAGFNLTKWISNEKEVIDQNQKELPLLKWWKKIL